MKYLVSLRPGKVKDGIDCAPADEAVIPSFPAPAQNMFLAVPSFKLAQYAVVHGDIAALGIDLDKVAERLIAEYPGLPARLIENYIVKTAIAVQVIPAGTVLSLIVTDDTAELVPFYHDREIRKEEIIQLWDQQPM